MRGEEDEEMSSNIGILDLLKKYKRIDDATYRRELFNSKDSNSRTIIRDLLKREVITEDDVLFIRNQINPGIVRTADNVETDFNVVKVMPRKKVEEHETLPLYIKDGSLYVLATIYSDASIQIKDSLQRAYNVSQVKYFLASKKELKTIIEEAYKAERRLAGFSGDSSQETTERLAEEIVIDSESDDSSIINFVNIIIVSAINSGASDIHIEPTETELYIRTRLDGVLRDLATRPMSVAEKIISRIKILSNLDIAEKRKPQDGSYSVSVRGKGKIDLRVAVLPTVYGEKIVMRILDNSNAIAKISSLGFSEDDLKRYRKSYTKNQGMVLVTGPTGSGKSTTLYATLDDITHPGINVITIEDPVEYKIHRVNQIQVNSKIGLSFASILRTILRADPDVILVGEIRDSETAKIAVEASQTGHLVLSTLHTNNAISAISRLTEMGVEKFLVSNVLESIIAQRLIRKLCEHCKIEIPLTEKELMVMEIPVNTPNLPGRIYQPNTEGCKDCHKTGYKGRVAVHEVVVMTPELEELIITGATSMDLHQQSVKDGTRTMRQSGWTKVLEGISSIQEVLRVTP